MTGLQIRTIVHLSLVKTLTPHKPQTTHVRNVDGDDPETFLCLTSSVPLDNDMFTWVYPGRDLKIFIKDSIKI